MSPAQHVVENLRDTEQPDHRRYEVDTVEQFPLTEGEAGESRGRCRGLLWKAANRGTATTKPLSGFSEVRNTAPVSPINASQKYSNEVNLSATSASVGAETISTAVPNSPPIAEKTRPGAKRELDLALVVIA